VQGDTHAFIVRIWHEATDDEGHTTAWRGTIDHVGSESRLYFQDLDGILRFIQEQTGMSPKQPRFSWRSLLPGIGHETI
jgi:hypothetical protein